MSAHDKIRVVVRVRPRDSASSPSMWLYDSKHVSSARPNVASSSAASTFTYDTVFGETASNSDIYTSFAQPIALSVLTGINGLLQFIYFFFHDYCYYF